MTVPHTQSYTPAADNHMQTILRIFSIIIIIIIIYLGDDQQKKVKITLVQADIDMIKQERERNNLSRAAARFISSFRPQRNHAQVRRAFHLMPACSLCVCVWACACGEPWLSGQSTCS